MLNQGKSYSDYESAVLVASNRDAEMRAAQNVVGEIKRVSHSEEFTNALQFLEYIINDLGRLVDSVSGEVKPHSTGGNTEEAKREYPPLLSVLNEGPSAIRQQAKRIEEQTARLREMLRV